MISKMLLKNFQGFQGVHEIDLAPITLIFGPNASGKSSIFRALNYVQRRSTQKERPSEAVLAADEGILANVKRSYEGFGVGLTFTGIGEIHPQNAVDFLNFKDDFNAVSEFDSVFVYASYASEHVELPITDRQRALFNEFDEDPEIIKHLIERETAKHFTGSSLSPLRSNAGKGSPWSIGDDGMTATITDPWWSKILGAGFTLEDFDSKIHWNFSQLNWDLSPVFEYENDPWIATVENDRNLSCWTSWWDAASHVVRRFELAHIGPVRWAPEKVHLGDGIAEKLFLQLEDIDLVNQWLSELTNGRYSYQISKATLDVAEHVEMETFSVHDKFSDAVVDFNNVGSGLYHILPILSACVRSNLEYIYVEQPEQHLHPLMQSKLAGVLSNFASQGKQIFIETHSENLLLGFQKLIRQGKISKDMVSVVYAEANENESGERHNRVFNLEMDHWGDLIDPFPLSFVELRAMYLFDES